MASKPKFVPGNFKFAVHRSRAGLGLFTKEPIAKGACVIEYTGVMVSEAFVEKSRSRYLFDVGGKGALDGSSRCNRARYINHSCRPNCEVEVYKKRVFISAKRSIKPGEELTYNYGKDYFDNFIAKACRCIKCRPDLGEPPVEVRKKPVARQKPRKTAEIIYLKGGFGRAPQKPQRQNIRKSA